MSSAIEFVTGHVISCDWWRLVRRIGAAIFGIGLGWIYVAVEGSVVAPICARVVFSVGALLLEGFKVVG